MADTNLNTSISAVATRILNAVATANADELTKLASAALFVGESENELIETAINTRVNTLITNADADTVRKLASAIKKMKTAPQSDIVTGGVGDISELTDTQGLLNAGGTSIDISDTAPTSPSAGDLWFDSTELTTYVYYDDGSSSQWVNITPVSSGGSSVTDISELTDTTGVLPQTSVTVVASPDDVPSRQDGTAGDLVYVTDNNKLFIHSGSGWDSISVTQNQSPTIQSGYFTDISLETDGTPTTIQLQATDPEGFALTWTYHVSDENQNICTIDLTGTTLTLTPTTDESIEGSFNITVNAYDNSGNSVNDIFEVRLTRGEVHAHYQLNQGNNTDVYYVGDGYGTEDISAPTYSAGTWKFFVLGEGGNGGWSHYNGGGSGYATVGQFTATGEWVFNAQMPTFRTTANENQAASSNTSGVGSLSVTRFRANLTADNTLIGEWSAQPGAGGSTGGGNGTSGGGGSGNAGSGGAGGTGGSDGVNGATYDGGTGIGTSQFETRRAHLESMLQTLDADATVTAGAGGAPSSGSHQGGGGGGGFVVTGSSVLPNYDGEDSLNNVGSSKTPGSGGAGWGAGGGATGYDGTRGVGGFGTGGLIVIAKV